MSLDFTNYRSQEDDQFQSSDKGEGNDKFIPADSWPNSVARNGFGDTSQVPQTERQMESLLGVYKSGRPLFRPNALTENEARAIPTSSGNILEWEGVVETVLDTSFEARLLNVRGAASDATEYTNFDLADVPRGDRDLVRPGAIFRWTLGFEARAGTKKKCSTIVFRRLPAWHKRSILSSKLIIDEIFNEIIWSDTKSTEK